VDAAVLRLTVRRDEVRELGPLLAELERIDAVLSGQGPLEASTGEPSLSTIDAGDAGWGELVRDALARIEAHELEKVVASRCSHVLASRPIDVGAALARIGQSYGECVRFAFQRGPAVFLGATPERLVSLRAFRLETDALAGSWRRDAADDEGAAASLLASSKELSEHAFVVSAISAALSGLCEELCVPGAPVVRSLRNVHHLWTPIAGVLRARAHVLELLRDLHPTPAVCGSPRPAALAWIAEHEAAPRGWYTGAVGWFDASGDGSFAVAIRSGVVEARDAWLYAGAGIVRGSDPARELAETTMKQAPLYAALGGSP
jgi:isochorismate synthase